MIYFYQPQMTFYIFINVFALHNKTEKKTDAKENRNLKPPTSQMFSNICSMLYPGAQWGKEVLINKGKGK